MDTATDAKEMWWSEVRPLVEELELRENRANHIDRASMIREVIERFDGVVCNAANASVRGGAAAPYPARSVGGEDHA